MAYRSNADIDDEDMADITDWVNEDFGTGESSQVTFDGFSCMKLDNGNSTAGRSQDVGTFGTRTIFSLRIYCDKIGTSLDKFVFGAENGSTLLYVAFQSDGLFVFDGASYIEVGTDLIVQDTWQEWTFDVNWVAQTVDIYLDGVLKASDVDCSADYEGTNGEVKFYQYGIASPNNITYIDWFKAGSDFEPPPPPSLDQEGFQFRADDGDEDEATPLASQDTNITRAKGLNTRLRFLINASGNPSSKQFQLEYRKKGTEDWIKVN